MARGDTHSAGWTDDRVERVRKLWGEGLSASQIAKDLGGGVSRNAVIGKVHRIGLAGRGTPSKPAQRQKQRSRARIYNPGARIKIPSSCAVATMTRPDLPPLVGDDGKSASVLTLNSSMCKFPTGDPRGDDFAFCGRLAVGSPYCVDHHRLCYLPKRPRENKPRGPDTLKALLRNEARIASL